VAFLDSSTGRLIVRIAYDGPPLAGKTETLRALGAQVASPVESFDEAYGRTLWFDWMNHAGGIHDGRPIECEVVALPGQSSLQARRNALLQGTDTVLFVADASRPGQQPTIDAFERLIAWHRVQDMPPGVVVQANKQDVPGSWDAQALRRALHLHAEVPIVESVATDARGVRHAFVFAVRAAVNRAAWLREHVGPLPTRDGPRTARQVLHALKQSAVEAS
jgi:signal recognition particle receptor subunit beta